MSREHSLHQRSRKDGRGTGHDAQLSRQGWRVRADRQPDIKAAERGTGA